SKPDCARPGSLFIDPEIPVLPADVLRPDVLDDRLVCHHPGTRHEEPACPEVPPPALLVPVAELLQKLRRRLPLDPLHPVARRDRRRARHEQEYTVLAPRPL